MNRISLTQQDIHILETALIQFGTVVTFSQLSSLIDEELAYTRKRVQKLIQQGWLTRIKKGVFVISDFSSRGSLPISHLAIVNHLVEEAYISFESALQFHSLFDQLPSAIIAISRSQKKEYVIGGFTYSFIKTSAKHFYGWEQHQLDGQMVKIAYAEKALIDLLQFHRTVYSTDLVLEILRNQQEDIAITQLVDFGLRANLTTRRILGFLMDLAKLESAELLTSLQSDNGVSYLSQSDRNVYNHKWKLYYDPFFDQ